VTVRCDIPPGGADCDDPVCNAIATCKEGIVCEICFDPNLCLLEGYCKEFGTDLGVNSREKK